MTGDWLKSASQTLYSHPQLNSTKLCMKPHLFRELLSSHVLYLFVEAVETLEFLLLQVRLCLEHSKLMEKIARCSGIMMKDMEYLEKLLGSTLLSIPPLGFLIDSMVSL